MRHTLTLGKAAFVCSLIAGAAVPTAGFAGVMSIADKAAVSLPGPTDQVDWRPYSHRHHRWHPGWRWGYGPTMHHWGYAPRWGYSRWGYSPRWGYRSRWGYSPRWGYAAYGSACPATWGYGASAPGGLLGAAGDIAATPFWAAGSAVNATTDTLFGW